jgi:hypothetical protein
MSISIQVAIRCRPFSTDDRLGVTLNQNSPEEGDVELINCDYSTTRFPFNYAWWSAYGFKNHINELDSEEASRMTLVDQSMVYQDCGMKIKTDVLEGNAVVLFAYGLSGSGKVFKLLNYSQQANIFVIDFYGFRS